MGHCRNRFARTTALLITTIFVVLTGCATQPGLYNPTLAVELSEQHNTPDGMTLDNRGNILLSCPNLSTNVKGNEQPARIARITPDDKLEDYFLLPVHPETGKVCPFGIDIGSDGNLYVADCQAAGGNSDHKSRVLRVVIEQGKPVRCETVVEGLVFANAVVCHGDDVYVTESQLEPDPSPPVKSGVYRFAISELRGDQPLRVKPKGKDSHLVCSLVTQNKDWPFGANGLGFAKDGTMYVCNFGDAELIAVKFDQKGKVKSQTVVAAGGPMKCTDGLKVDPQTGHVYIADFLGNAVHRVDPATGKVTVLARNGLSDGRNGELDKCSEVCLRGNRLYVANIDLNMDGNTFDKPYTISVIDLPK